MSKTVRVRIAVAVDPDGDWNSCGWRGDTHDGGDAERASLARDPVGPGEVVYWLEADLPIPAQQTFEATVQPEGQK